MTTRLDRLVTLLETGSTQLIRSTAAQQLADVQKQHPDELFNLLTRVVPFLQSKSWDTRIAAAKAIGGIVENADKFDPNTDDGDSDGHGNGVVKKEETEDVTMPLAVGDDLLQLTTLDMKSILTYGKRLLGSAGKEYEYSLASLDPAARLARQKKNLTARLGLGGEYMDEDLVDERDFAADSQHRLPPTPGLPRVDTSVGRRSSKSMVQSPMSSISDPLKTPIDETGLSKRQLNQLKRKNKANAKLSNKVRLVELTSRKLSLDSPRTPSEPRAIKTETSRESGEPLDAKTDYFSLKREAGDDESKVVSEFKGPAVPEKSAFAAETEEESLEWPFERLCEYLMVDLFDHKWEVRHGAAMGLREVIRVHGAGAGRVFGKSRKDNDARNQRWLDDLACRICCVFLLDRFGDFISDNVVAPIRETVGQTLGALLLHLAPCLVHSVYQVLYRMIMQTDLDLKHPIWEVCHGGMIGLKYLVAVRKDLLVKDNDLMDGLVRAVIKGLSDYDDDVRAVSAATLIPITQEFVTLRPDALNGLINIVWEGLSNLQDDLSASTGSIMDLLAKLCSFRQVLEAMKRNAANDPSQSFRLLVPRLFPFLRHTITSVRAAVLRALLTFLRIDTPGSKDWINGKALRLVFQNLLVERNETVLRLSFEAWTALTETLASENIQFFVSDLLPHLPAMAALTLHPIGVTRAPIPMNPSLLMRPSGSSYTAYNIAGLRQPPPQKPSGRRSRKAVQHEEPLVSTTHNVDGPMIQGDIDLVGEDVMLRSRIYAARALGLVMKVWPENMLLQTFEPQLALFSNSPFASTQVAGCMIIEEYARAVAPRKPMIGTFSATLASMVEQERPLGYADMVRYLQFVRAQCHSLLNTFRDVARVSPSKLPTTAVLVQGEIDAGPTAFSLRDAERILNVDFDRIRKGLPPSTRLTSSKALADARMSALQALEEAKVVKDQKDARIRSAAAAALVSLDQIPKKPSHLIKAMMESIKAEEDQALQKRAASGIVSLIRHYTSSERRGPIDRIISNLVKYCCVDTSETPEFRYNANLKDNILSLRKEEDRREHADAVTFEKEAKSAKIMRRGAKEALEQLAHNYGAELLKTIPSIQSLIEFPMQKALRDKMSVDASDPDNDLGQETVDALSTLRALAPKLHLEIHQWMLGLAPMIIQALESDLSVFRYAAAKCFATVCSVTPVRGMTLLVEKILPNIGNALDVNYRQGTIECVYHLIQVMGDGILPYVIFLIVPVLGRMSDSDNDVRLLATTAFATLVKLVPLEAGIPDPPGFSQELLAGRDRERKFITQMLDVRKVEPFHIPVAIKAELRPYQQEGVNWLAFLNRYHLHGILCDDMGLGKTLQTLCIIASDHYNRKQEYAKTGAHDSRTLPSLIVCPPSLTGHWQQEIRQYAPFLTSIAYIGLRTERQKLVCQMPNVDIVITSYDVCRNDAAEFTQINWNYCVLDEGHLIKNPKAKITISVKQLKSNHRLILSGTPIQNNVLELWSLFDFLMPGFLGSEKVFQDRFAKPIAASRFSKSSSKEQEAGALALEALHKQVLPFLLRRLKEEVLNDLPPKIIQNYYCDLSPLQKLLFEDFSRKEKKTLADKASSNDREAKQHIFQALQYMRKLCNSPSLIIKPGHKQYDAITRKLSAEHSSLRDITHAPKLTALRDLLVDCGIGVESNGNDGELTNASFVSQHRALIFCQMKEMLDIVQDSVLQKLLPSVQYLRLDGSVEANKRQSIVNKFNSDPSYDVLLLTTSVGGLGLNLTGADTVIFVEHDWNPQKDLQAMDRAHRIGQKKVVNVYRLITRGTLEEKILNLQRFKIDVASTVVNQQNAGLGTMETDQILDLFNLGDTTATESLNAGGTGDEDMVDIDGTVREKGKKGYLDDLEELWDDRQYEEEYDLEKFLKGMKA